MARTPPSPLPAYGDLTQAQRRMTRYVQSHPTYYPRSGRKLAVFDRLINFGVVVEQDDGTHAIDPDFEFQTWDPDTKTWT